MIPHLAVAALGLLLVALVLLVWSSSGEDETCKRELQGQPEPPVGVRAGLRQRRGVAGQRQRYRGRRDEHENHGDEPEDHQADLQRQHDGGQEVEQQQPSAPISRKEAYEARMNARNAEREARERAHEEEVIRAARERQAREQEEAERWMKMFSVDEAGEAARNEEDEQEISRGIVEFIVNKKMAPFEDIGAEFGLKTSEVVDRVRDLERDGRITGIIDDRGKFIHVSEDEMREVARLIRSKGRIEVAHLAEECNALTMPT